MDHAVLLITCPDQKGIVARVSNFVFEQGCNILSSDQHTTDPSGGRFFMRIAFDMDDNMVHEKFEAEFKPLGDDLDADWHVHYASRRLRMGILVSKQDHCLADLLYRQRRGELPVDIPLVVSNHEIAREVAERYEVPFHHVPVTKETKLRAEQEILDLVKGKTDFLVLARYMQILTDGFIAAFGHDIINIHHSFLPSFKGADPYRQAYERGVKVIGATAHFVTAQLDEGPIIRQEVDPVYYKDRVDDLRRKGRNLEQRALAGAVRAYLEHRIIKDGPKTIVFQ
jgi:formyltetrahydrofolate deformylase